MELSSIEPFVESVPAAAVMCFLWIHGIGQGIKVAATELKVDSTLLDDYFNGFCNKISDAAAQRDFDKNISECFYPCIKPKSITRRYHFQRSNGTFNLSI